MAWENNDHTLGAQPRHRAHGELRINGRIMT
jgi:hypothetical protein